jgi:hypothetical protein
VIDVSNYPGDTLVPWFRSKVRCAKCGARHSKIDVRPNWKEVTGSVTIGPGVRLCWVVK